MKTVTMIMSLCMRSIWNCLTSSYRLCCAVRKWSFRCFNFSLGKKEYKGDKLKIEDNTILILEGIHALNPELTPHIPDEKNVQNLCFGIDHYFFGRP